MKTKVKLKLIKMSLYPGSYILLSLEITICLCFGEMTKERRHKKIHMGAKIYWEVLCHIGVILFRIKAANQEAY